MEYLKISEILERVSDSVLPEPEENYCQIGIRSHGKGIFHKEPVTGKSLGNKRVFRIHPDCFIVNIVFAWEQAVAKTSANEIGMIASHRFPMFRPKNNLCNIDYLTYFFKTPRGKYLLALASPGGAGRNKTLGQNEFALLEIKLPSVEEQQKIAKILLTWDKAIGKLEALIAAKQQRKKALIQQLLTRNIKFPGSEGVWKEVRLSEISNIETGTSKSSFIDDSGDKFIIDMGAISREGKLIPSKRTSLNEDYLTIGQLVMPKDDIGGGNIIGRTGYIDQNNKYVLGDHVYKLTVIEGNSLFISYLINSEKINKSLRRKANGTAQLGLGKKDVLNQVVSVPLIDEQQKIAAVLSAADKEITIHQNQLSSLKQQKKGLMQQLLTGKRRVQLEKDFQNVSI